MDARAQQAREHHEAAARTNQQAENHRAQRDRLVRQLREEDKKYWSYDKLAAAVGCSKALIRLILKHEEARDVNPCLGCGKRGPYIIIRQQDCLEARCTNCGLGHDIGWDTRGYEPPEKPAINDNDVQGE